MIQRKNIFQIVATWLQFSTEEYSKVGAAKSFFAVQANRKIALNVPDLPVRPPPAFAASMHSSNSPTRLRIAIGEHLPKLFQSFKQVTRKQFPAQTWVPVIIRPQI